MTKYRKPRELDLQHYRDKLQSYVARHEGTDVEQYVTAQINKRLVIVEVEFQPHHELGPATRKGVVLNGDRWTLNRHAADREVDVLFDGFENTVPVKQHRLTFLEGGPRGIYWPPGVRVGTYGVMGGIAKGLRSGKVRRGR